MEIIKISKIDDQFFDVKNVGSFPPELLKYLFNNLRAKGFDIRSVQDMLGMLKPNSEGKNLIEWHEEWKDAFNKATESINKRKNTIQKKKELQKSTPNINWERLKELGYTTDIYEAGYVAPDGKLLDLSGKKEGFPPGQRALDHREAGGYEGMKELMGLGYIRMHAMNNGYAAIDLCKEPTPQQYNVLYKVIGASNDGSRVDLRKHKDDEHNFMEFDGKISPFEAISRIKGFYSGKIKTMDKKAQVVEKIMYVCRGVPGSGKSTLAKQLAGKNGVVFETDDFFMQSGKYVYDTTKKSDAHNWNIERCIDAMRRGVTPIVISNTQTRAVESEPYVRLAIKYGYKIKIEEPNWDKEMRDNSGKWNFDYLKGKNVHEVPDDVLRTMIDRYENKPDFVSNLKKLITGK